VDVLGIVGMTATRHRWPNRAKTGIAETLQSNPGRVIAHNGVVPHKLKELAAALGCGLELRFVGKFLEEALLLFRRAIHELMAEFRLAPGVDPIEPREETVLSLITYLMSLGTSKCPFAESRKGASH